MRLPFKTLLLALVLLFPSPDGEEVSATAYAEQKRLERATFPSPDGEEVSATVLLFQGRVRPNKFPSPDGEEVSATPRFERLTEQSF